MNKGFQTAKIASTYSNGSSVGKRVGAALFSKSNLLSFGWNTYGQTHPSARGMGYDKNLHAEHKALLKRQYYSNYGSVLYVYRETADGRPACSKPCDTCQNLIKEAGIRIVRYLNKDGKPEEIKL